MKSKLQKKLILMSKLCIYSMIVQLSMYTLAFALDGNAQQKSVNEIRVQLTFSEPVKLEKVLAEVEKSTDFHFAYMDEHLSTASYRLYSVSQTKTLGDLLLAISKQTDLAFKRRNSNIYIIKRESEEAPITEIFDQTSISGKITDENGEPLPGATIQEKGTTNGTVSDVDGKFSLNIPEEAIAIVSFVGYETQEVPINGRSVLDIKMSLNSDQLEEVVVVGYGTQKKISLTTAVATVKSEELTRQSTTGDLRKTLQGLVPGLTVSDHGGFPGDEKMNMQIRGISSVNGQGPLVLVDGAVQSLNGLDPSTIESISVLKDAASTAMYGSRGSNGIILISTKSGKKEKLSVSYNGSYGLQNATTFPTFLDTEDLLRFRNDQANNAEMISPGLGLPVMTEGEIQDYVKNSQSDPRNYPPATVDWGDNFFRIAPQTRHSMTLEGGGDVIQSLVNLSYFYQEGIVWDRSFERINARINNTINIAPSIKGTINFFYEHGDQKRTNDGNYEFWLYHGTYSPGVKPGILPYMYSYDEEGNYFQNHLGPQNTRMQADIDYMGLRRTTPELGMMNSNLEWEVIKGLKLSSRYAINRTWWNQSQNLPKYNLGWASRSFNTLEFQSRRSTWETFNLLLNFEKSFSNHELNALIGYSAEEYSQELQRMFGREFFNNELVDISSGNQNFTQVSNDLNEWGLRSLFGRISYNFSQKYFAEISLRSDGSSRFPEENRYSLFPGASVAWNISNEDFWNSISSTIPLLKIRYSYGQTGAHDGISNYSYIPQLNLGQAYNFATTSGSEYNVGTVNQSTLSSEELSWEIVTQNNIGIDMEFLDSRLSTSFDIFQKNTTGVLLNIPIPTIMGLNPSLTNAGRVENKGWEFNLSWRDKIRDFEYNIKAGIASVEDKIVDYAGLGRSQINWPIAYRWEGSPVFALLGYKVTGIFQNQEEIDAAALPPAYADEIMPGDYRYEDVDGDGQITWDEDAQLIGDLTPKYTVNLNFQGNWKNFDISMLWYGALDFQTAIFGGLGELGTWRNAPILDIMKDNYWKEEGDDAYFARPLFTNNNNYSNFNDRQTADLSYLRLKSLMIGYTLPSSLTKKLRLNKTRVFFNGTNLLTISKYFRDYGLDPENPPIDSRNASDVWLGAHASARKNYPPQLKTFNFGLELKF